VRVAVLTWTDRLAGGVEGYLDATLPELARLGHHVSLWHETSEPEGRARLAACDAFETYRLGNRTGGAVEALRAWRPDVILSNGLSDSRLEGQLHLVASTAFVAHNYHGTCVSGTKCWSAPVRRPCERTFGVACLAEYYPRRCGGLSVSTMVRLYRQARTRLETLRACPRLVVLSQHMRDEYLRHGFDPQRVTVVPFGPDHPGEASLAPSQAGPAVRLAFMGRLERLKGADLLVEALVAVHSRLARPVTLTVMGDGSERHEVERRASEMSRLHPDIAVRFSGWLAPAERDIALQATDLLVVPSVWPEPFGLVGLDAARLGVPAVAFDVGGVRDWLVDGVTGRLAGASPPTSGGLADAIVAVLADPVRFETYRLECRRHAFTRSPALHARGLSAVLAQMAGETLTPAPA
jgi:glycosyltransferase involved in cell wall biosynthesis